VTNPTRRQRRKSGTYSRIIAEHYEQKAIANQAAIAAVNSKSSRRITTGT